MRAAEAIEEIRKVREDIARQCDFDTKKLVAFYMERQRKKNLGKSGRKKRETESTNPLPAP
jgi:hypothetical protein